MTLKVVLNLFFIILFSVGICKSQDLTFNKSVFYTVLESGNKNDIDFQLSIIHSLIIPEVNAYEGVLLMKKAGVVVKVNEKLSLFKSGRAKLESSILKDNNNIEYHFLRLIIQENAPPFLRYREEINSDAIKIQTNFKSLSPIMQKVIFNYCKKSSILKIPQP